MTGESPDLGGIVRRVDDEIRRRGGIGDAFGDGPHYTSDGRDGHDDYDCAAADRRALLDALRDHVPEVDGYCDSGIYLGCSCGWTADHASNGWLAHLGLAFVESQP